MFIKQPESVLLHLVEAMQRFPDEAAPKRLLGDYLAEHRVHSAHPMAELLIEDLRNAVRVGSVITHPDGVHLIAPRTLNTHVVTRVGGVPEWRRSELMPSSALPDFWGDPHKTANPPIWVETRLTHLPWGFKPTAQPLQQLSYSNGHDYIPAGILRPGHPVGAHKDLRRKVKPTQLSRTSEHPLLSEFTDPEGKVTLHHYAAPRGEPEALDLDPERFGESPWSRSEVRAERTPKVFFYLRPEDKEHFLGGRTHYKTRYDAGKIYDMMADPKNIVSRMAARPPFNLAKTLGILRRLGYHGVFYSGSFPTVALFKKTRVTKLARIETTRDLAGIEHHIRTNDVHPADSFHGLYADALEDNGDPRAELVRHSVQAAQEHPNLHRDSLDAKQELLAVELDRAKEMAGLPPHPINSFDNSATVFIGDYLRKPAEQLLSDALTIHPFKGPRGRAFVVEHALGNHEWPALPFHGRVSRFPQEPEPTIGEEGEELPGEPQTRRYRPYSTAYFKAMSGPEFVRWLNRFDRDQKHIILKAFKRGGRQYNGVHHLKRSGYGYCPECKAPFIRLDKATRRVTCPHGHTRILKKPGGPRKLAMNQMPPGVPKANYWGAEGRWEALNNDPDLSNRVHSHPAALAEGHRGYTPAKFLQPEVARVNKALDQHGISTHPDLHSDLEKNQKEFGHNDVVVTPKMVADARTRGQGEARQNPDQSLIGTRVRFGQDEFGRRAITHVFPASEGTNSTKPTKLAATRAPTGGAIVNNQFHTGGQFLPRAFKRISRVVAEHERAMRTRALKLARHSPADDVLTSQDWGALKGPKTRGQYESLLGASLENKPSSILPTVEELKSLGEAGQSVKGQYGHLGRVLEKHLGHENARLFAAANAILSPQSAWEHHSRGAMRALRLWREAGSPTEPKKVARIIKQIPTELYPMMDGQKARKLLDLFTDPEKYIAEVHHVSTRGRGKTVDFGRAHHDPSGIPIDTHQSKLTLPTLRDGTKVSRKLAKAIAAGEDTDLHSALLRAQQRLVDRPAAYNAYKVALAHAAQELGWEPREMQESVWASIVSLVAARNLGIPPEKILNHLKHESTFHAWNVGGLLSKPELLSDVKSLTGGREEAFAASASRPPPATGEVQVSNPAALEDAASRVPPNTSPRGAWHPVEEAMRTRLARRVPKQFTKIAPLLKGYTEGIPHADLDRWLGKRNEKRLSGNKVIRRDPNGDIHVFLHQTPVVTAHPNGDYRVRSGGWNTPTTRRTIQAVTGASVHSKDGVMYINGKPLIEGMLATQLPPAPEVDYRPPELTPEDYYAG